MNKPRLSKREQRWNRFLPGDKVRILESHGSHQVGVEATVVRLNYFGGHPTDRDAWKSVSANSLCEVVTDYSEITLSIDPIMGVHAELVG